MPLYWRLCKILPTRSSRILLANRHIVSARCNLGTKYISRFNRQHISPYFLSSSFHATSYNLYPSVQSQPNKNENKLNKPPPLPDLETNVLPTPPLKPKEPIQNQIIEAQEPEKAISTQTENLSLWGKFKKEMIHYYHGFRLLGLDIKIASGLCFQMLRGHQLTRRERNQLVRTVADIFRLVPFAVFIIVPFMEFLLPVYIKLFPFMLPSTFKEQKTEEEKIKMRLIAKLKMAKFLQDTISQTSVPAPNPNDNTPTLEEFSKFLNEIRTTGVMPQIQDIVKYSRLFEDQLTLDSLDSKNLKALCQILDINTIGPANLLRLKLVMRVRQLKVEDQLIHKEGVDQIPPFELQSLCRERGMRSLGVSENRLRKQLSQWLELHLVHQVPISLLLLSRAMYMHDTVTPAERLQKVISALPEAASSEAQINILNQQTDQVDAKTKIELLRREQETIKKERAETKLQNKTVVAETIKDKAPEMVDKAKVIKDETVEKEAAKQPSLDRPYEPSATIVGPEMEAIQVKDMLKHLADSDPKMLEQVEEEIKAVMKEAPQDTSISIEDLGTISQAIAEIEVSKEDLHKEEVAEIKESLGEATKKQAETQKALIENQDSREAVKQTKTARKLAGYVDGMLKEMNHLVENLSEEKTSLQKDLEMHHLMAKQEDKATKKTSIEEMIKAEKNRMIEVNQLLLALRKIQKVPDDTKWQRILEVMDEDKDGHIELKHVLSVIELMGSGNMKLDSKEMSRILDMLDNEELLEKAEKAPPPVEEKSPEEKIIPDRK